MNLSKEACIGLLFRTYIYRLRNHTDHQSLTSVFPHEMMSDNIKICHLSCSLLRLRKSSPSLQAYQSESDESEPYNSAFIASISLQQLLCSLAFQSQILWKSCRYIPNMHVHVLDEILENFTDGSMLSAVRASGSVKYWYVVLGFIQV